MLFDAFGQPVRVAVKPPPLPAVKSLVLKRFVPFMNLAVSLAPAKHQKPFRKVLEAFILSHTQQGVIDLMKHLMHPPNEAGDRALTPAALPLARKLMNQYTEHSNKAELLLPTKPKIVIAK